MGEAWGKSDYMVTKPVKLKAMMRVCSDLTATEADDAEENRIGRWRERSSHWTERVRDFRNALRRQGRVERVARIHRELARSAGIAPHARS